LGLLLQVHKPKYIYVFGAFLWKIGPENQQQSSKRPGRLLGIIRYIITIILNDFIYIMDLFENKIDLIHRYMKS